MGVVDITIILTTAVVADFAIATVFATTVLAFLEYTYLRFSFILGEDDPINKERVGKGYKTIS